MTAAELIEYLGEYDPSLRVLVENAYGEGYDDVAPFPLVGLEPMPAHYMGEVLGAWLADLGVPGDASEPVVAVAILPVEPDVGRGGELK